MDIEPEVSLSAPRWETIKMLVKEAVNNAKKHGRSMQVAVSIASDAPGQVVCSVRSDGPPILAPIRFGYGLSRLKELVEGQGGALRFTAPKTGGAVLWAEFGTAVPGPVGRQQPV